MKKKIIIIVLLLAIALIAIIIPKSTYQKWFGKNKDNENNMTYNILVYLEDQNNRVVGVNVPVDAISDDIIKQKWELLTTNSNLLPDNYSSSLPNGAELLSYEVIDSELKIFTNESIKEANGRKALETLAWTFITDEIEEVSIYVNEEKITTFNDYSFKTINKKIGINLSYETLFLYESNATTIIYQEDEIIVPVTYFHLNDDICSYIVMKALEDSSIDDTQYDYTFEESILTLDFVDASILSTNQISTIVESIGFNLNVDSLNINNSENLFYQRVFNEIKE